MEISVMEYLSGALIFGEALGNGWFFGLNRIWHQVALSLGFDWNISYTLALKIFFVLPVFSGVLRIWLSQAGVDGETARQNCWAERAPTQFDLRGETREVQSEAVRQAWVGRGLNYPRFWLIWLNSDFTNQGELKQGNAKMQLLYRINEGLQNQSI